VPPAFRAPLRLQRAQLERLSDTAETGLGTIDIGALRRRITTFVREACSADRG
jgi:hypothetical protein